MNWASELLDKTQTAASNSTITSNSALSLRILHHKFRSAISSFEAFEIYFNLLLSESSLFQL
jgi:hypothetical protein